LWHSNIPIEPFVVATTNGSIGRLECHNNEMVLLED
jgi:hypothetical protein